MLFASGEVKNFTLSSSGAKFYAPQQTGATTGSVIITLDAFGAATAGWWQLSLNRTTLVHTAQYNDLEMPGGGKTYTMTPDKCVVNNF